MIILELCWLCVVLSVALLAHGGVTEQPPSDAHHLWTNSTWRDLVSRPGSSNGLNVKKAGMLPPHAWRSDLFNTTSFHGWLDAHGISPHQLQTVYNETKNATSMLARLNYTHQLQLPPPLSHRCKLVVNHQYKFIMIRTRKAASTTLMRALKQACHVVNATGHNCTNLETPSLEDLLPPGGREEDLEKMWMNYTVFSTARNPFARAASGYLYLTTTWSKRRGRCKPPSFQQFCEQPMLLGTIATSFGCRRLVNRQHPSWDWYHVEPADLCLRTATGQPAVDFVVRSELMHSDSQHLMSIINARRPPGLPELSIHVSWSNTGVALSGSSTRKVQFNGSRGLRQYQAQKHRRLGQEAALGGVAQAATQRRTPWGAAVDGDGRRAVAYGSRARLLSEWSGLEEASEAHAERHAEQHAQSIRHPGRTILTPGVTGAEGCAGQGENGTLISPLECQQRQYAAMFRACGVACVRGCAQFYQSELQFGQYPQGWPLGGLPGGR